MARTLIRPDGTQGLPARGSSPRTTRPLASRSSFLADLATCQRSLFLAADDVLDDAGEFADAVDVVRAAAAVPDFVAWLVMHGPPPLARSAAVMRADPAEWRALVRERLRSDGLPVDAPTAFVISAVLQPYAEAAAAGRIRRSTPVHEPGMLSSRCPVCSGLPVVGVLCEEGQGAKRMLVLLPLPERVELPPRGLSELRRGRIRRAAGLHRRYLSARQNRGVRRLQAVPEDRSISRAMASLFPLSTMSPA